MLRVILLIIGGLLFTAISGIVFAFIGFLIGGNFMTDFHVLGIRGYSATVNLSLLLGLLIGAITSGIVFVRYCKED